MPHIQNQGCGEVRQCNNGHQWQEHLRPIVHLFLNYVWLFFIKKPLLLPIFHHSHIQLHKGHNPQAEKLCYSGSRCICHLGIITDTEDLRKVFLNA